MTCSLRKISLSLSVCFIIVIFLSSNTYSREDVFFANDNMAQELRHDDQEHDYNQDSDSGDNQQENRDDKGNNHNSDKYEPAFDFDPCRDNPNFEGCNGVM